MTTSTESDVTKGPEFSGPEAAELAQISYRQLDHWARQGWVLPSVESSGGRGRRRRYSAADVVRLSALRHFAKAGWPVNELGPIIRDLDLDGVGWLFVGSESGLRSVSDDEAMLALLEDQERFTAYPVAKRAAQFAPDRANSGDATNATGDDGVVSLPTKKRSA